MIFPKWYFMFILYGYIFLAKLFIQMTASKVINKTLETLNFLQRFIGSGPKSAMNSWWVIKFEDVPSVDIQRASWQFESFRKSMCSLRRSLRKYQLTSLFIQVGFMENTWSLSLRSLSLMKLERSTSGRPSSGPSSASSGRCSRRRRSRRWRRRRRRAATRSPQSKADRPSKPLWWPCFQNLVLKSPLRKLLKVGPMKRASLWTQFTFWYENAFHHI